MKYVVNNPTPFIVKVNHSYDQFRGQSLDEPLQDITAKHGYALVAPVVEVHHGASTCTDPKAPLGTACSRARQTSWHCDCRRLQARFGGRVPGQALRWRNRSRR